MIKYIKEIIAGFTFVVGAATFIYGLGIKNANKDSNSAKIESTVNKLWVNDSLKTIWLNELSESYKMILPYMDKQDKLVQNYSKFVQDNTRTVQEWKTYMNGLTFEIIQEPARDKDKLEIKTTIIPIK